MKGDRGKGMEEDKGKSDGRGKGDGNKAALAASAKARGGSRWGSASLGGSWGTSWQASGSWQDSGWAGATADVEPDLTSPFCWLDPQGELDQRKAEWCGYTLLRTKQGHWTARIKGRGGCKGPTHGPRTWAPHFGGGKLEQ